MEYNFGVMNPQDKQVFDRLLGISPKDLLPDQVAFLDARRSYLTDDQLRIYGEVMDKYHAEFVDKKVAPPLYVSKKDQNGSNK